MITRHIHQTWKDAKPPENLFRTAWIESWKELNPGWDYTLWTDEGLDFFVRDRYPDFYQTWLAYPSQIMRVDAWRYLLLKAEGGLYVDLDFLCLEPLDSWLPQTPALHAGRQDEHTVSNALLWAPYPELPFFRSLERALTAASSHANVISATGPYFLSDYARHQGEGFSALPPEQLYPLRWDDKAALKEQADLSPAQLRDLHPRATAITFWAASWVDKAARFPGTDSPRILVGVCSCRRNAERRQACRDSWLRDCPGNVTVKFFAGEGEEACEEAQDLILLAAPDDYLSLPRKVREFFRYALEHFEFDWLFKCDDDSYVVLSRLRELLGSDRDLVGNEFIDLRGTPSGGAGYFLSREFVELIAADKSIDDVGDEDVLIGSAAIRLGARSYASPRLRFDCSQLPRADNDIVSAHWCSPACLRSIHRMFHETPLKKVNITHPYWQDSLTLYKSGCFRRDGTFCSGNWVEGDDGLLNLHWDQWGQEIFAPRQGIHSGEYVIHRKIPMTLFVEVQGGLGNQMFQYAYGLALADRLGVPLKAYPFPAGRPYALHIFGIQASPPPAEGALRTKYFGAYDPATPWPLLAQIHQSNASEVILTGYFQDENYFKHLKPRLKEIFRLSPDTLPEMNGCTPIGVHVRRGDFINTEHDICRDDFFFSSMALVRRQMVSPRFLVFSDDAEWCQKRFSELPDVEVMPAITEKETLAELSSCKAFILSNSTFGWWPAWLSDVELVIAPSYYLRSKEWNIRPSTWIGIPPEGLHLGTSNDGGQPDVSFLENRYLEIADRAVLGSQVEKGREVMKQARAVICGLARELGKDLVQMQAYFEALGSRFAEYRIIIFENDSTDDTLKRLRDWEKSNLQVTVLSETLNRPRWGAYPDLERASQMAEYRNCYLGYAKEHFANFDYLLVIDTDLRGGIFLDGIATSFAEENWDFIGSTGLYKQEGTRQYIHYDAWAYRACEDWSPVTGWFYGWHPQVGSPLVRCNSCFGGCGIYRFEVLEGVEYSGEDCEHVCLHRSMSQRGHNRIFLNPAMVTLYW